MNNLLDKQPAEVTKVNVHGGQSLAAPYMRLVDRTASDGGTSGVPSVAAAALAYARRRELLALAVAGEMANGTVASR